MKRAFLFPGQGAQVIGMGKDIYEKYEEARKVFDEASNISGIDVKKLCFEGPEDELNKTENTQLAIMVTSLAILEVLKSKKIDAKITCGLSLGEYTALVYAGIISFEDGIKLIKKRGYYMGNLIPASEYEMAAVIGLDVSKIEDICSELKSQGKFVVPANYNCSSQTVVSGEKIAVEEAIEKLKTAGAKRVIPLKTSGPFHTEKLLEASKVFGKELENIKFNLDETSVEVIKNIDGTYYNNNDNIKEILEKHIISPVRFDKAIKLMQEENIDEYIEIGPRKNFNRFC